METRIQEIRSRGSKDIRMSIIPGHFATSHSHVNYYVDLTGIKNRLKMARAAAEQLAVYYQSNTPVDTILCMEGTETIGAFLAETLARSNQVSMNAGKDIAILTPEINSNGQMIFRDNLQKMVWNKNVLLLIASASTGKTIRRLVECLQYYSGRLIGVAALFSAIGETAGLTVRSVFSQEDIPHYRTLSPTDCEMCRAGQKIDAIINSYGYSKV